MLFLKRLFQAPKFQSEGRALFAQIAAHARLPVFYTAFGVPDTIDGRFEMLSAHAHAVFHRLKGQGADADAFAQAIYDAMFQDLDGALRELGVADLGVGRRIKIMTEALNGRIQAYDLALAADETALRDTIRRNVYGTTSVAEAQVAAMAEYLRALRVSLNAAAIADLQTARVALPQPTLPLTDEGAHAIG